MSNSVDNDRAPAPRFLVIDSRVPEAVRRLLEEADGCLNMAFTVGGTACARRALQVIFVDEDAVGNDWTASLHALREKHPAVAPTLFQLLEALGKGDEVLQPDALKALIATVKAVAYEIYVLAAERIENLAYLKELLQSMNRETSKGRAPVRSK